MKSQKYIKMEKEIIEYLWQIIDDIDTASDMAKSNDVAYRNMVEKLQKKRWNTGITTDGYKLNFTKMKDPKELIEECKSHLRDNTTHQQQYKTDIQRLITALERALSIANVAGQSEQLFCPHCEGTDIQKNFYTDTYGCNSCGHSWAK